MSDGWSGSHRYYGCILHFDIRNGKGWVQHDGTGHDVATELMELRVAKDDIVLGFRARPEPSGLTLCAAALAYLTAMRSLVNRRQ